MIGLEEMREIYGARQDMHGRYYTQDREGYRYLRLPLLTLLELMYVIPAGIFASVASYSPSCVLSHSLPYGGECGSLRLAIRADLTRTLRAREREEEGK